MAAGAEKLRMELCQSVCVNVACKPVLSRLLDFCDEAIRLLNAAVAQKMRPDVVSFGTLITGCERAALWQQALQLLGELDRRSLEANVVTYSAAISACEKALPGHSSSG